MSKIEEWEAAKTILEQLSKAAFKIEVAKKGQVPSIKVEIVRFSRTAWVVDRLLMPMLADVLRRREKAIISDLIGQAGMLVRRLREGAGQEAREILTKLHGAEDVQPKAGEGGEER